MCRPITTAGRFHTIVAGNIGLCSRRLRYWFCDRFAGHFLGAHLLGGQFNIGGVKNNIHFLGSDFSQVGYRRYQGWMIGAGVAYGYAWILGKHWNVEGEIGVGWIYTRYDSYPCANCGKKLAKNKAHNYVGPTKAAVNLVYIFLTNGYDEENIYDMPVVVDDGDGIAGPDVVGRARDGE